MPLLVRHVGKIGDVIYSMCALRGRYITTGEKSVVILHCDGGSELDFSEKSASSLVPLLASQPYIQEVRLDKNKTPKIPEDNSDINFAPWLGGRWIDPDNLARSACRFAGVEVSFASCRWINISPADIPEDGKGLTLINFTGRYPSQNSAMWWSNVIRDLPENAHFVGTKADLKLFEKMAGKVLPHKATANMFELARLIAGSGRLIANQSSPLALAHALGKPVTVEVAARRPDCVFLRSNACYPGVSQSVLARYGVQCTYSAS